MCCYDCYNLLADKTFYLEHGKFSVRPDMVVTERKKRFICIAFVGVIYYNSFAVRQNLLKSGISIDLCDRNWK